MGAIIKSITIFFVILFAYKQPIHAGTKINDPMGKDSTDLVPFGAM